MRRRIRLIEGNAKCRHLKHGPVKGLTCTNTHCMRVYSTLIHTGKGGRVEPERRGEGQQFTQLGPKIST
jgi:hypothetical protein